MLRGTITLHSSQFPTGMPLVIELLDGELNRRWQGAAIVNMPAPFPVDIVTNGSVIFVALPSGQRAQIQLKPTAGAPDGAIGVVLPPIRERTMSFLGEGRSPTDSALDGVWVRLWSRDATRSWSVRPWKPSFQPGPGRSVSGEFDAHDLRRGQHYLQTGFGSSRPRMTAVPVGGASFTLQPSLRRADETADVTVDIDVGAGSPAARIMLSYLSNGDLERAQIVGDTLLLSHPDRLDVTTAVLGGYYLLVSRDMGRLEHLLTTSLSKWAKWIPDFAVIAAWKCLRQEQPDAEEARDRFLDAARCGLPIFTHGLRSLVDGLRMIEADGALSNDAVRKTGERLRKFASVANWRSTFTTFFAAHPSKPIYPGEVQWLADAQQAILDPLSCFPWVSELPQGQASRDEFDSHISAAFSRAFASPPGTVSAAEAYKAFNEGITNLCEATP
ncbi:hypothetical protein [Bradyrhizobium guangzhouense]|nr:hypothetical protein [Bradyrhizobium guangzhouense]